MRLNEAETQMIEGLCVAESLRLRQRAQRVRLSPSSSSRPPKICRTGSATSLASSSLPSVSEESCWMSDADSTDGMNGPG